MATLEEIRADAAAEAERLEAVAWARTATLAARWNVDPRTVRKIPRTALPYLELPGNRRRYRWADVHAFEAAGGIAHATEDAA